MRRYLAGKWPEVEKAVIIYDKIFCNEIIENLRTNTGLSIRKIAELLGLHRRVVERLALKHNKSDKRWQKDRPPAPPLPRMPLQLIVSSGFKLDIRWGDKGTVYLSPCPFLDSMPLLDLLCL